jgi:hypothetical protein
MKKSICNIAENDNGDQIRSYILETMNHIQEVRNSVMNLQSNKIMLEECNDRLQEAYKLLITFNGIMGEVIGYTIAEDIWDYQKVSLCK